MEVVLGVDTLSYHCRLEGGEIALEEVFREVVDSGASFVQLNAQHLRDRSPDQLDDLRALAAELSLGLTLSGDVVGRAADGDSVESGVRRVLRWAELAELLGSPFVRVSSGFYRNELLGFPDRIRAEQRYVTDVLAASADQAPGNVRVLLENHSDFTPEEYVEIIEGVGSDRVAVFLDVINPVSMLLDPLPVVRQLAPWAPAGHAKDYRLVSHYVEDRFHRRGFDVQYCYPGEGVADLKALLGALVATEQDGPYLLSIEGLDNHPGVADQRERLTASVAFLRTLLASAMSGAAA
ncbi:sugar phosphate isomerase/epimerase family protein [Saccharopolyspora sp. 5N708]|uniref:sugar phosphate isomerase/epimerase family protein n=1 Tax=Saccharopolyspora sp. 5N708 TaxID=3457424 RepID=UPI003FD09A61